MRERKRIYPVTKTVPPVLYAQRTPQTQASSAKANRKYQAERRMLAVLDEVLPIEEAEDD